MAYSKPSIIQSVSIPNVMTSTDNFLFQAINGSGKTGAYGVPSIMKVDKDVKKIQIIILANTRELIRQIYSVLKQFAAHTEVTLVVGESGADISTAQILITVPGYLKKRLADVRGKNKMDLTALKMIVYDEADELFSQKDNHECFTDILEHLKKIGVKPQHCMYSATFNDDVLKQASRFVGSFVPFTIKKEALKLKGVKNYRICLKEEAKNDFVAELHVKLGRIMSMIFVNFKTTAQKLQAKLKDRDIESHILIGGIEAKERDDIIDGFRKMNFNCLISTNVLARGIDVPEVDLVLNYDVPLTKECGFYHPDYANFMHRVGRTGRFGTDGLALTMTSNETEEEVVDRIAKFYEIEILPLKSFEELITVVTQMRGSLLDK